jgi:hypothetical protein
LDLIWIIFDGDSSDNDRIVRHFSKYFTGNVVIDSGIHAWVWFNFSGGKIVIVSTEPFLTIFRRTESSFIWS